MPSFSNASLRRLETCVHPLQLLFSVVVRTMDCTVVDGRRDQITQELYFKNGRSKVHWPNSAHNAEPPALSRAVDVVPYIAKRGAVWTPAQCYYFGGYVMRTAQLLSIPVRWGGDWDSDGDLGDQDFNDLVHFELLK